VHPFSSERPGRRALLSRLPRTNTPSRVGPNTAITHTYTHMPLALNFEGAVGHGAIAAIPTSKLLGLTKPVVTLGRDSLGLSKQTAISRQLMSVTLCQEPDKISVHALKQPVVVYDSGFGDGHTLPMHSPPTTPTTHRLAVGAVIEVGDTKTGNIWRYRLVHAHSAAASSAPHTPAPSKAPLPPPPPPQPPSAPEEGHYFGSSVVPSASPAACAFTPASPRRGSKEAGVQTTSLPEESPLKPSKRKRKRAPKLFESEADRELDALRQGSVQREELKELPQFWPGTTQLEPLAAPIATAAAAAQAKMAVNETSSELELVLI